MDGKLTFHKKFKNQLTVQFSLPFSDLKKIILLYLNQGLQGAIIYLHLLCGGLPGPALGLQVTSLSLLAKFFLLGSSKKCSCKVWSL